jgi:hypothetical protein
VLGALNPLSHEEFGVIFGMIMTLLIAMEFNHSILHTIERIHHVIQVKTVVLISSRPIFNATLRAAASWLFLRVARSTVIVQIAALRSRLEKQPTDLRRSPRDLGDGALDLGCVYWLVRERDDRYLMSQSTTTSLTKGSGPNRTKVVNRDNLSL